jgi:hypothetical protein
MADPRRLGKRGAYRLGAYREAPAGARLRSGGREPSFGTTRSRGPVLAWLVACAVTAVILGLGAAFGLWFLPFVAGMAAGAWRWRVRAAVALVVLAVIVGWGAALWWPALSGAPAGATARVIAALAGLPPHAAVGVGATLLIGVLQALAALWLTRAVTYRLR